MPTARRRPPSRSAPPSGRHRDRGAAPIKPLDDAEIRALQALLDTVPAPLEPLDVSMLDGYLCGVLVQPEPIAVARWMPHVTDVDGRALPRSFHVAPLHALVLRRHAELAATLDERDWFDPWIFELAESGVEAEADGRRSDDTDDEASAAHAVSDIVMPWVAGIATAFDLFPALTEDDDDATREPLALLYRHLDADDLEDADALLAEIESMAPATDLGEAIEGIVRAVLLLADASSESGGRVGRREPA